MSLKEDLREILDQVFEFNTDYKQDESKYVDQILSTISKHLPEKKKHIDGVTHDITMKAGYNTAIDDFNKLLTTNKEGSE